MTHAPNSQNELNRINLLGTYMHTPTMAETIQWIDNRLANHLFTQHVVVNVAKVVNMRQDATLRSSVEACDIINIDGMGVVWGAKILGYPVHERVAGIDLFQELLALSAQRGYPVYLLGAKEEVVEKVVRIEMSKLPALNIVGYHHGYFWDDEETVVKTINKSGARLLFVAISSPKKENFINRWKDQLGVDFVMGVGGTFDVVAGKVKRAPMWMQKVGLEWLYRVIQEPRRMWKRYLITNTKFGLLLFKEKMRQIR